MAQLRIHHHVPEGASNHGDEVDEIDEEAIARLARQHRQR